MKRFNDSRIRLSVTACVLATALNAGSANADFTFGKPVNLKTVIPVIGPGYEAISCFSYDGLEIYVDAFDRVGGSGEVDVWVSKRATIDGVWGALENLGPAVNSHNNDAGSSISADGLTLCFFSDRPGGHGNFDIYMATRATKNDPWGQTVNLGPNVNRSSSDCAPWISADGLELYLQSNRSGGFGGHDIYVTKRMTLNAPWGEPVNLSPVVNSAYYEIGPSLSPDGRLLFFQDIYSGPFRPGGFGGCDIWMTMRSSLSEPWQTPLNLGPNVNGPSFDTAPRISADGHTLYFNINTTTTWDNFQAAILPVVDFNADGIVDAGDVCIMIDHWHTNYPLCDIGPFAWGDGIVDVQDLIVLAEHLFELIPPPQPAQ